MTIVNQLAKYFQPYITITGLAEGKTYTYMARSPNRWPVVSLIMHRPKCRPGSWLYIAIDGDTNPSSLQEGQRLYIGSQIQDRMFRGDGLKGNNFHHREMRSGNGEHNLISYLQSGKSVKLFVIPIELLVQIPNKEEGLRHYASLIAHPAGHPGYWFEQVILREDKHRWAWNTIGVEEKSKRIMKELGV